jgi:hypothetical protein
MVQNISIVIHSAAALFVFIDMYCVSHFDALVDYFIALADVDHDFMSRGLLWLDSLTTQLLYIYLSHGSLICVLC